MTSRLPPEKFFKSPLSQKQPVEYIQAESRQEGAIEDESCGDQQLLKGLLEI